MPDLGPAHLPVVPLIETGRFVEAHARLLAMAARKPDPATHYLLGLTSVSCGDPAAAVFHTGRAAALAPADADILAARIQALSIAGKAGEAVGVADDALRRIGRAPGLLLARAEALGASDRHADAVAAADDARAGGADPRECQIVAGINLCAAGRFAEARERFLSVGAVSQLHEYGLGVTDVADAVAWADRAAEASPDDLALLSGRAFILNYHDAATPDRIAAAHLACGRAVAAAEPPLPPPAWAMSRDPDRQLRLGIVSPDLKRHAVVSFLRPLLEHHDRSRLRVHCYSTCVREDDVSRELRALVPHWRWMRLPHPGAVAETLRADRIDVAVDLAGHTAGHSLAAFHRRCAPVQLTWLGYPNTTGLRAIDARVVDSITDPPGHEAYAAERLARIDPCFLCYKPLVDAPDPGPGPASRGGPFTFGSFNFVQKISPSILALWARVLSAAPDTRLALKSLSFRNPEIRERTVARLEAGGVDRSRVDVLEPTKSFRDHLDAYRLMDVALDTFPYHGTTTTCEALWMGVPVITLEGDRHAARVGPSLLSAVGLPELSAPTPDRFVELALSLMAQRDRLAAWRAPGPGSLRARMLASPLCDGPAFAARFEAMARAEWRRWCAAPAPRP